MIRVIIVEDVPEVRCSIRAALEQLADCTIVGEATNLTEVIELAQIHHPDIVLVNGDASDAHEITWLLRFNDSTIGIIILTQFPDEIQLFQFIKMGANAYKKRTISPEILAVTIRRVCSGEFLFSDEVL